MSDPIKDAQKDIKNNKIKIYFEAVGIVPIPLGLRGSRDNWPNHQVEYIGGGCCDMTNSPECTNDYRQAHNDMVKYGTLYNKEIAQHFGLETT